jgi:ribonuclease P protein component
MLAKPYRLPATIRLQHPLPYSSSNFIVKFKKNIGGVSRFGFIVGKKVAKSAVKRNRIKRVFRSCIEQDRVVIKQGYDFLFFLKKSILEIPQEDLYNEVHTFLKTKQLLI